MSAIRLSVCRQTEVHPGYELSQFQHKPAPFQNAVCGPLAEHIAHLLTNFLKLPHLFAQVFNLPRLSIVHLLQHRLRPFFEPVDEILYQNPNDNEESHSDQAIDYVKTRASQACAHISAHSAGLPNTLGFVASVAH
jgi:hypothetical protein